LRLDPSRLADLWSWLRRFLSTHLEDEKTGSRLGGLQLNSGNVTTIRCGFDWLQ